LHSARVRGCSAILHGVRRDLAPKIVESPSGTGGSGMLWQMFIDNARACAATSPNSQRRGDARKDGCKRLGDTMRPQSALRGFWPAYEQPF